MQSGICIYRKRTSMVHNHTEWKRARRIGACGALQMRFQYIPTYTFLRVCACDRHARGRLAALSQRQTTHVRLRMQRPIWAIKYRMRKRTTVFSTKNSNIKYGKRSKSINSPFSCRVFGANGSRRCRHRLPTMRTVGYKWHNRMWSK